MHNAGILADPRLALFHPDQVEEYFIIHTPPETTLLDRAIGHLRRYSTLRRYLKRYMSQVVERSTDPRLISLFRIEPNQFGPLAYFMLLHAWLFHYKMMSLGLGVTSRLFAQQVQNVFKQTLTAATTPEKRYHSVNKILETIEFEKRVFYRSLDDALGHEHFAGAVHYVLWRFLYSGAPGMRHDDVLQDLTTYVLRMILHVKHVPREVFMDSDWVWPEWPPGSGPPRLKRHNKIAFD